MVKPRARLAEFAETFPFRSLATTLRTMFRDALRDVVEGVEGGLAGMVMDFEGIPLDSYSVNQVPVDIEAVGIEASVLVKSIRRATEMLEAGDTDEVSIKSERMVTLIRVLNDTYFVALTLQPGGNLGKGRYLLRTLAPRLKSEL
jgi:predicted regulator of Ras-like GTPase activity (Roadblock/LC7/MglB family)